MSGGGAESSCGAGSRNGLFDSLVPDGTRTAVPDELDLSGAAASSRMASSSTALLSGGAAPKTKWASMSSNSLKSTRTAEFFEASFSRFHGGRSLSWAALGRFLRVCGREGGAAAIFSVQSRDSIRTDMSMSDVSAKTVMSYSNYV